MKPSPTDIDPLPHRRRNLLALTGLTSVQVRTSCSMAATFLVTVATVVAP